MEEARAYIRGQKVIEQQLAGAPAGQAELNEYNPGQGLSSRVDTRVVFGVAAYSPSLGTDIVVGLIACPGKVPVDMLMAASTW